MPDETQRALFGEFCALKKGVNGPDVHMKLAGTATRNLEPELKIWRLATYNNFCSVPSAALFWREYSDPVEIVGDYRLEDWVRRNWAGIPIRANRRPARSPQKLTLSLRSLAGWVLEDFDKLPEQTYEEAWTSLDRVFTWGRYVKVKFLETCRRYLGPEYAHLQAPNIRASGGWSPRKALAIIYPEYAPFLTSKRDDRKTIANVHSVAAELRDWVSENWVPVSNYEEEALLCNFRQTLSTRKTFYVGRTIDSEYEYDRKIRAYWGSEPYGDTLSFFAARQSTFPAPCLGELMGWDGVRADLSDVLRDFGYIWSDVRYSYRASRSDLAHPVRWK